MTPQAESVLELFRSTGAYLEGHFRLTSGLHSGEYLQCALVLQHPRAAEQLGRLLADELRRAVGSRKIELVVSPALGGLIIGHEVARALGTRFLFTERDPARSRCFAPRFHPRTGRGRGGGGRRDHHRGQHAGCDRRAARGWRRGTGGGFHHRSQRRRADVGVPRVALATLQVAAHYPEQCPLCAQGIPVVKPGSRPA